MNIFYLDKDPKIAAEYQYNKHVVKMILESAQMLCATHHVIGNPDDSPYKLAHKNHPSTIWVRENSLHYDWLWNHMVALGDEYTKRYGKTHLSITKMLDHEMWSYPPSIPHEPFEQPPQCMPDEYKAKCAIHAYWNYYIGEKHIVANPKKEQIYQKIPMAIAV
jgi:hypothetical protein